MADIRRGSLRTEYAKNDRMADTLRLQLLLPHGLAVTCPALNQIADNRGIRPPWTCDIVFWSFPQGWARTSDPAA
jgi:hypothetical protein